MENIYQYFDESSNIHIAENQIVVPPQLFDNIMRYTSTIIPKLINLESLNIIGSDIKFITDVPKSLKFLHVTSLSNINVNITRNIIELHCDILDISEIGRASCRERVYVLV